MFLYEIGGNEMLVGLSECIYGAKLMKNKIACPAFADDVTIIAVSKEAVQQLVSMAYKYSKKWRFSFNPTKCKLIVYGKGIASNVSVKIGNHCIQKVNSDQHLGTILSCKEKCIDEYIQERIQSCKTICYATQSLGSHRVPVTTVTGSKLYWQVCIPKLCYGMEVITLSDKSMDSLEQFHTSMAKHNQGLPTPCSNPGSLSTIGWKTLESHVDIMRLMFLWRLLLLPMECIYKVVLLNRLDSIVHSSSGHCGPVWQLIATCKKYNLLDTVIEAMESGSYMSLSQWKKHVKFIVNGLVLRRWKIICKTYKSLIMLKTDVNKCEMSPWWVHGYKDPVYSKQNRVIIKLLLNVNRQGRMRCQFCYGKVDSVHHILFECPCIATNRAILWETFLKSCPKQLQVSIEGMCTSTKCKFILNAFNVQYVAEWKSIYDNVSNFITKMYEDYKVAADAVL